MEQPKPNKLLALACISTYLRSCTFLREVRGQALRILNQGIRLEHLLGRFVFIPFITGDWIAAPGSQGPGISPSQQSTKPGPRPCHHTRRIPGISEWSFFHHERKLAFSIVTYSLKNRRAECVLFVRRSTVNRTLQKLTCQQINLF